MANAHEDIAADLHAEVAIRNNSIRNNSIKDMAGADIKVPEAVIADKELEATHDGDEPTEAETNTLRRIGENIPASAYLIAVVELCERFTYYGAQGLFQNYVQNTTDGSLGAAGLGLGKQAATGLGLFFQFFCYVTPILGAIISDQYWGKYKTILFFACVYWCGLLILWTTSLPGSLAHGAGVGGYVTSLIIIGFGTGGIKSNIAPLIADQYQRTAMAVKTLETGERVIIDPTVTYQRIYMIFYACINVGSLSLIATPFMERFIGFWAPFLLSFCMFCVGLVILILRRKSYIIRPPQGSVITDAFKCIGLMIASRNMDAAKPSWRAANGKTKGVNWDDHFVDLVKRALGACKIFALYPIFWVCYNQISNNFVTQAQQMAGHGMPNDFMQNFDPITIIIFIPLLDRFFYPLLRKLRIPFRPIARISVGFILAALGLAWAAITQKLIYSAGPCFDTPLDPSCADQIDGVYQGNNVHIAVQTPAYIFIGLAEIFLNVTGLEYAYTKAPPSMKSFVQSLYLFTTAIAAAIGEALVPVSTDPSYLWLYTGVAAFATATGIVFYLTFHKLDAMEDELNALDKNEPALPPAGKSSKADDLS